MNIFLTGATGFVGQRLFRVLKEKGHSLTCLLRPGSDDTKLPGAKIVRGQVWDPAFIAGTLNGINAVVHLVGIIQERRSQGNTFERVHLDGTRNLVLESQKAGVAKFLHMSALGTRPHAISSYHKSKWSAEEFLRVSGLNHTIFRPSVIFGELPCAFLQTLIGLVSWPVFTPVIGAGTSRLQPVYVGDIAKCFEAALCGSQFDRQTCELGGTESYSFLELMEQIENKLRKRKIKLHLPYWYMNAAAWIMDACPIPMPLSRDQLVMLKEDNTCGPQTIKEQFGFDPTPFRQWLDQASL